MVKKKVTKEEIQENEPEKEVTNATMEADSENESTDTIEPEEINDETAQVEEEPKEEDIHEKLAAMQDKHLRLSAEFDNFRKRTLREKAELIKSAGEGILVNILPVVDDFERAMQAMESSEDIKAVKDGVDLIYNKLTSFLSQNGVKTIDAKEQAFDTDLHEAVTKFPAPSEDMKGKVVDVVEKGYILNEKVIRFAKVVVGE